MRTFDTFLFQSPQAPAVDRIANLMAGRRVDPVAHIEAYLGSVRGGVLLEEWMGVYGWMEGFFTRLRSAWHAFWEDPKAGQHGPTPSARLAYAKSALNGLHALLQRNSQVDPHTVRTILLGLEQSLQIIGHLEPMLKDVEEKAASPEGPQGDESQELPDDLHAQYAEIMGEHDRLVHAPETEDNVRRLVATNDRLLAFQQRVEGMFQHIDPHDPQKKEYRQKIGKWLSRIDKDAAFREVQNLINFAKRRVQGGGQAVRRPAYYQQAVAQLSRVASGTADLGRQKEHMARWYAGLSDQHPVKEFVREEMRRPENKGRSEADLFLAYVKYWTENYPHHLAGT